MNDKKSYNSKKVIIFSCCSLFFGLLSLISYSFFEKAKVPTENDPVVVLNKSINYKVNKSDSFDLYKPSPVEDKEEIIKEERVKVFSLKDLKGKFVIVIGTFRNKNNAFNLRNEMHQNGNQTCDIIFSGKNLYWVFFKSYDKLIYAKKDITKFKIDGWVKKI